MIPRILAPKILQWSKQYPVVTLTGPRQSGKTTLAKTLFPQGHEVDLLLETAGACDTCEIKAAHTVHPDFFKGLDTFEQIAGCTLSRHLIYGGSQARTEHNTRIHPWPQFRIPAAG